MIQVFATDEDREEVHGQLKLIEGYNCLSSGLTPPTANIVQRKYIKTRMHRERPVYDCLLCVHFLLLTSMSVQHDLVAQVEEEIENMKPTEDTVEISMQYFMSNRN